MRHPFDGVNDPSSANLTRRSALGAMVAGLVGVGTAAAQIATTNAIGEEGAVATTRAVGEEGGRVPLTAAVNEAGVTTQALGEEGGARPASTEPFGEEAGRVVSRPAPGLEDGGKPNAQPTTKALNEEGAVATTLVVGEEGGLTRALNENGGPTVTVPVKPNTTELKDEQLKAVWADMAAAGPAKGVQACAVLYGSKNAVGFLKDNLKADRIKVPQADEKKVAGLIAALDSDTFDEREKADAELAKLGEAALAAIEKALRESRSPEQRMRLERLRDKIKDRSVTTQARRGLEVLVALRTPEAKELLEKLAKGDEKEWLTEAARQALARVPK
jgi:hypothetical protein